MVINQCICLSVGQNPQRLILLVSLEKSFMRKELVASLPRLRLA